MSILSIYTESFCCQEKYNIHGNPNMFFLLGKSKLKTKLKSKKHQGGQRQGNGNRLSLGNNMITE